MKRILINALMDHVDETVAISGWVGTVRDQKRVQFVIIRDHTGSVQVVNDKTANPAAATTISDLTAESAVTITGLVVVNDKVKLGGLEVQLETIQIRNRASTPLPIDRNSGLEARLDWRFLDLRDPVKRLIFAIQTTVEQAMRRVWKEEGFLELHSPKFMAGASEGGAELFQIEYFGRKACLAQSPQLYKQMAMAAGFDRVFEIGPVFRANPSFTSRHDTEFTSVDIEMSWIDSHHDIMDFEERWFRAILLAVLNEHGAAIKQHFGVDVVVPVSPFPRVTMADAYAILARDGYVVPREHKGDLDPEGERRLCRWALQEHGHEFVFVIDYPINARPFYHMRHTNDPSLTMSFDLLWKGLEVTTGAQREHRYEVLARQAAEKKVDLGSMGFYANCFQYGCPPHGGYGLGLTRLLMVLLNASSVREVTFVYRGPNRLEP